MLKDNYCLTLGIVTRNLYRVFYRFCPRIGEHGFLLMGPGCEAIESFADFYVIEIRRHGKAGVGKSLNLIDHSINNSGCAVANVNDTDSGTHIDNLITVDI